MSSEALGTASSTPMAGSDVGPIDEQTVPLAIYEAAVQGRRDFREAFRNARQLNAELLAELQQFVNGVETGLITSPADETLANVTRRARAAISRATANPIDTLPLGEGHE